MADTRISALPAVAAPAVGDEFACNQAGVTKKETKAQITAATDAALAAHIAVTAAGVHGSATATGANTLVHRDAAGDADATAFNAAAGAAGTPSHTFTADPNTGHYNYAADELGVATGGAHRAHWNTTGAVILNDAAASTFMTGPGVTIQQGAYDDEAVALQSTDVAHGMTNFADTDTYFRIKKFDAIAGGAALIGLKDADGDPWAAFSIGGFLGENVDTTKTTAGRAIVEAVGYIKSGAGIGDTNADGNVFGVRTRRGGADVTLLLVDEDADLHVLNDIVVAGVVDTIDVANHVHTGGAMGPLLTAAGITDRTRTFLVQGHPYDVTVPQNNLGLGWLCADSIATTINGHFKVPDDFVSGMTVTPVVVSQQNGNLWSRSAIEYEADGEDWGTNTDDTGYQAIAVTTGVGPKTQEVQGQALSAEAIGDYVHCIWIRDAAHVNDTVNDAIWMFGWEVSYTADS